MKKFLNLLVIFSLMIELAVCGGGASKVTKEVGRIGKQATGTRTGRIILGGVAGLTTTGVAYGALGVAANQAIASGIGTAVGIGSGANTKVGVTVNPSGNVQTVNTQVFDKNGRPVVDIKAETNARGTSLPDPNAALQAKLAEEKVKQAQLLAQQKAEADRKAAAERQRQAAARAAEVKRQESVRASKSFVTTNSGSKGWEFSVQKVVNSVLGINKEYHVASAGTSKILVDQSMYVGIGAPQTLAEMLKNPISDFNVFGESKLKAKSSFVMEATSLLCDFEVVKIGTETYHRAWVTSGENKNDILLPEKARWFIGAGKYKLYDNERSRSTTQTQTERARNYSPPRAKDTPLQNATKDAADFTKEALKEVATHIPDSAIQTYHNGVELAKEWGGVAKEHGVVVLEFAKRNTPQVIKVGINYTVESLAMLFDWLDAGAEFSATGTRRFLRDSLGIDARIAQDIGDLAGYTTGFALSFIPTKTVGTALKAVKLVEFTPVKPALAGHSSNSFKLKMVEKEQKYRKILGVLFIFCTFYSNAMNDIHVDYTKAQEYQLKNWKLPNDTNPLYDRIKSLESRVNELKKIKSKDFMNVFTDSVTELKFVMAFLNSVVSLNRDNLKGLDSDVSEDLFTIAFSNVKKFGDVYEGLKKNKNFTKNNKSLIEFVDSLLY